MNMLTSILLLLIRNSSSRATSACEGAACGAVDGGAADHAGAAAAFGDAEPRKSGGTTPSPPTRSFPTESPRVELSGRLPIKLYGHENSHPLELRVCLSQPLRNRNS